MSATFIMILGPSGTGKSRSIKTLNPEETIIYNTDKKLLSFPGAKDYSLQKNMVETSKIETITASLAKYETRPKIKNYVIDTITNLTIDDFQRRKKSGSEKGFALYDVLGTTTHSLLTIIQEMPQDIFVFMMGHTATTVSINGDSFLKAKTMGKFIDNYIDLESRATIVLYTGYREVDGEMRYSFQTQGDGRSSCKSPEEMFSEKFIDNDLQLVRDTVTRYYSL